MTAKEYLNQYIDAQNEIEALTEEVQRLRSLAEKMTVAFDSTGAASGTKSSDKIAVCVEKIIESEDKIKERASNLASLRDEIYNTICSVKDGKLRTLLVMRYISGKSFEAIAASMAYTYKHITHNLHPLALEEIEKIISKTQKDLP